MTWESSQLPQIRQRIQRTGRILAKGSRIARVVLLGIIAFYAALIAAVWLGGDRAQAFARQFYENNTIFQLLKPAVDSGMEAKYQGMIGCFVMLLAHLVLFFFTRMVSRVMDRMAESGQPFDTGIVKALRRNTWFMLVLVFYNLPMGIIVFLVSKLLSYIFEYGVYIQQRADETNRIQEEMIVSFAEITENKSGQTGQHIKRVSEYTRILAEQLGMKPEDVEALRIASTMHDVGKLLIPSEILEKPGRLTDAEFEVVRRHTLYGGQLLENVEGEEMSLSRTVALEHHERFDGKGYPARLTGEAISLAGRIVAVADVYDALTSKRSYKDAWQESDAYDEILKGKGTQFDPQVVEAFQAAHDSILAVRERFRD